MLGRCSFSLDLKEYDPEIERILTEIIAKKKFVKEEMDGEQPRQLKEYFTPGTYNSPLNTRLPNVTAPFDINFAIIQLLPAFHGFEFENPFKHIDIFLETCFNNL